MSTPQYEEALSRTENTRRPLSHCRRGHVPKLCRREMTFPHPLPNVAPADAEDLDLIWLER